jgi:tetratricopeptide (TPR) repeat protein
LTFFGDAQAQDPGSDARARELYDNGSILFDEGRYQDAVVAWQEAYRLSNRPALLYNIASAQERMGHWEAAVNTLNAYRALAPAMEREMLDRRIANLERRLSEQRQSAPPPSAVAAAQPASPAPTTTAGTSTAPPPPNSGPSARAAVGLIGGGVVGVGVGTAFALRASEARADMEGVCVGTESGLLCPDNAQAAVDRDRASSWVADGSFLVGGALLMGGTLISFGSEDSKSVFVGPGSIGLKGSF